MNMKKEKIKINIFEVKDIMAELRFNMMTDQVEISEDSSSLKTKVENFSKVINLYIDEINKAIKILENIEKELDK